MTGSYLMLYTQLMLKDTELLYIVLPEIFTTSSTKSEIYDVDEDDDAALNHDESIRAGDRARLQELSVLCNRNLG